MSETTVIISNLHKNDFVASGTASLSLANHIKLAILNLPPPPNEPQYSQNISHYSELSFLSRIIIIFKTASAAARVYDFLASLQTDPETAAKESFIPFSLPPSAKISLQENLLSRSRSSENLDESSELSVREDLERFRTKHSGDADYEEPKPEKFDMRQDLLRSGIDISHFNSEAAVKEFAANDKQGDSGALGRSRSVTKTLFKPSLSVGTDAKAGGSAMPPPSPTITLDETF